MRVVAAFGALASLAFSTACDPPVPPRDVASLDRCARVLRGPATGEPTDLRVVAARPLAVRSGEGEHTVVGAVMRIDDPAACESANPAIAGLVARGASLHVRPSKGDALEVHMWSPDPALSREILALARDLELRTTIEDVRSASALPHSR
ncbi:MAG: hypothetical protein JST00_09865 [Deltaproteobacteria bacterium]|nr:hypothetical protein [Deltaproteobacteria bacterium]